LLLQLLATKKTAEQNQVG